MRPGLAVICVLLATAPAAHALCAANASPQVACKIKTTKKPKVRITRDGYGVPHVKARSLYDVGYGMGQAQAQDRLFQMELVRKSATGNVAELFGRDFLSADADARRQFYSDEELQYLQRLDSRSLKDPNDEDEEFYEHHRTELAGARALKAKWDKFIFGQPVETDDFQSSDRI